MPDISMCPGTDCNIRETCYRYKAKPDQMQSYSNFCDYVSEYEDCEYFLEITGKDGGYE